MNKDVYCNFVSNTKIILLQKRKSLRRVYVVFVGLILLTFKSAINSEISNQILSSWSQKVAKIWTWELFKIRSYEVFTETSGTRYWYSSAHIMTLPECKYQSCYSNLGIEST